MSILRNAAKKRTRSSVIISLLLIAAMVVTAGAVLQGLPVRPQEKMLSKSPPVYDGVIELWLAETFYPGKGSHLRWLVNTVSQFEKKNKGTFIEIKVVEPSVAARLIDEGDVPDAIICSGGVLSGAKGLLAVGAAASVLPAFTQAVSLDGKCYGVPVSAGAYTILYNTERLNHAGVTRPVTADDLENLFRPAVAKPKVALSYAVSAAQTEYISYSAALFNMLDISVVPQSVLPPNIFSIEAKMAWADFVLDGKSAGYVCTQKEVFRIRQLEAGGSAFPWEVHQAECSYTDQLLALYIFDGSKTHDKSKEQALLIFAELLLSEQRQTALADIGAFSVLDSSAFIYPAESAMHLMEAGLKSPELIVPNMLTWRDALEKVRGIEKSAGALADKVYSLDALLGLR